ncbi:MAG: class I SAM-dependent RNA methyltransferase [Gemmatimonadetes bacterium]|nr:class I SAM-dependent RNA methyltransferase [Gemmatimonadota bacterium]
MELTALGLAPGATEPGGVSFRATPGALARANLQLRTASRLLVRRARFTARAMGELERKAGQLDWDAWLPRDMPVRWRVTSKKSRLYHQKGIAERLAHAAGRAVAAPEEEGAPDDELGGTGAQQLVVVRVLRDELTVSVDASGEHLHRRGYRLATAKAPLRETLAAALVLASAWDPAEPLADPFCGSGTIAIEAAMLARRIPPGLGRGFACERWPGWDGALVPALRAELRAAILPGARAPILASDRDAGAVEAAAGNLERAGVAADVTLRRATISEFAPSAARGALVSNPPWGLRVGEARALRDLYARLGQVLRERAPGWSATLLLPRSPLERATELPWQTAYTTQAGGVAVRMVTRGRDQG